VVERELLAVPGVADVVSFGGEEKTYEIKINPTELHNYDLSPWMCMKQFRRVILM
jgi:cobalt-zinc-cadmium resistance protein CzcA